MLSAPSFLGRIVVAAMTAVVALSCSDSSDPIDVNTAASGEPSQATQPTGEPAMSRAEAEQKVREATARFTRIDRLESKLLTYGEFQKAQQEVEGATDITPAIRPDRRIWFVAVGGQFSPGKARAGREPQTYPWGYVIYDADTKEGISAGGGPKGTWPPYFDRMPDRSQR